MTDLQREQILRESRRVIEEAKRIALMRRDLEGPAEQFTKAARQPVSGYAMNVLAEQRKKGRRSLLDLLPSMRMPRIGF